MIVHVLDLPDDVLAYMLAYLNVYELSLLDCAVTSHNGHRYQLYNAFRNVYLYPCHFPNSRKEVNAFERVDVYYGSTVFSNLDKGPFLYDYRYDWLLKRQIKVKHELLQLHRCTST